MFGYVAIIPDLIHVVWMNWTLDCQNGNMKLSQIKNKIKRNDNCNGKGTQILPADEGGSDSNG